MCVGNGVGASYLGVSSYTLLCLLALDGTVGCAMCFVRPIPGSQVVINGLSG
jgi:hypothetical protein